MTHAESSISGDDADYLDLEAAKKALDAFRVSLHFLKIQQLMRLCGKETFQ